MARRDSRAERALHPAPAPQRGLKLSAADRSARVARAAALCEAGRLDEAESLLRAIVNSAPADHAALYRLATVLREKGDSEGAIDHFCQAIAINDRTLYRADLGMVYLQTRQLGEAEECFRRVLAVEPGSAPGLFGLGAALLGQKAYAAAVTALEAALAARPAHAETHLSLGIAFTGSGRIDQGIHHCLRAVELNPASAGGHLRLGMALLANNDFPAARGHLARAVELDPNLAEAHYQLALALQPLGLFEAALAALKRALTLHPRMMRALDRLGKILCELQQYDEAIGCYQQASALDLDITGLAAWHRPCVTSLGSL